MAGGSKSRPPTGTQSADKKLEGKSVGADPPPVEKLAPELRTSIQPLLDSLQESKYKNVSQFSLLEMVLDNADAASLVSANLHAQNDNIAICKPVNVCIIICRQLIVY